MSISMYKKKNPYKNIEISIPTEIHREYFVLKILKNIWLK